MTLLSKDSFPVHDLFSTFFFFYPDPRSDIFWCTQWVTRSIISGKSLKSCLFSTVFTGIFGIRLPYVVRFRGDFTTFSTFVILSKFFVVQYIRVCNCIQFVVSSSLPILRPKSRWTLLQVIYTGLVFLKF